MTESNDRCSVCNEIEPKNNDGWMVSPSGRIYCPECMEYLFRQAGAPQVAAQMLMDKETKS